jgi:hypothetical protein
MPASSPPTPTSSARFQARTGNLIGDPTLEDIQAMVKQLSAELEASK